MDITNIRFGDPDHTIVLAEIDGVQVSVMYEAVDQQLRDPQTDEETGVVIKTSGNRTMQAILDVTLNADPPVEIAPYVAPPPPTFTKLSKNLMWERMTDEEAVAADAALRAQPPRVYRQYDGATYISTEAELFPVLMAGMTQLFGAERAAEILAPDF